MQETIDNRHYQLLDIPLEIWQFCIFEYWLGPIQKFDHDHVCITSEQIMKFKREFYPQIVSGLDLIAIRAVHKFCCTLSKSFKQIFVVRMNDFWRKVSNMLEMVVYWKRYESYEGCSLAIGDLSVYESLSEVKMQKLIEATEMNSNREYEEIIDPSRCNSYRNYIDVDLKSVENDIDTEEMHQLFEKRVQNLMISEEKFEKIRTITQLDGYHLFLHKALILSLDMISYFDSEKNNGYSFNYDTFENCCLISDGLFTKSLDDLHALGLMIDMDSDAECFSKFKNIASRYIAISINFSEWSYQDFQIPNHTQYLCFQFGIITYFEEGQMFYTNFLEEQEEFSNVRDLTIRITLPEYEQYWEHSEKIEKNILAGITRKRFPKLLRISMQGFSNMDHLLEFDFLRELLYVEIIPFSIGQNYQVIENWRKRRIHNLVRHHFIENDSMIHHLVAHANIARVNPDADYTSIEEFYNLSRGKFIASVSHSSITEYYSKCWE